MASNWGMPQKVKWLRTYAGGSCAVLVMEAQVRHRCANWKEVWGSGRHQRENKDSFVKPSSSMLLYTSTLTTLTKFQEYMIKFSISSLFSNKDHSINSKPPWHLLCLDAWSRGRWVKEIFRFTDTLWNNLCWAQSPTFI